MVGEQHKLRAGLTRLAPDIAALDEVVSLVTLGQVPELGNRPAAGRQAATRSGAAR